MPKQTDQPEDTRILMGTITSPHGIRGEVRIKVFTEDPMAIGSYGPLSDQSGERSFVLSRVRPAKNVVTAALEGISDRDAAEALRGTNLFVARAALPKLESDEFYHADLIGILVAGEDGSDLGKIIAVHDFGAGPLIEIAPESGATLMAPFSTETMPEIDFEAGTAVLIAPPGLLTGADNEDDDADASTSDNDNENESANR